MFEVKIEVILLTFTLSSYHLHGLNSDRFKSSSKYIDLSYSFSNDTIYFPGQKNFALHKDKEKMKSEGYSYSSYSFSMGEHGGTHLDAPFHFNSDGWTVDQIPASNLIDVPAFLIDVSKEVNELERPHEFILEVKHIIQHETESNQFVPFGGVVLIYTGWSKYWPNKVEYLGWDNSTNVKGILNFPGISEDAARWLVNERHIIGIGLDTASIDPGNSKVRLIDEILLETFPAHVVMAENQIYNLENVANLHLLLSATKNYCQLQVFVLPLKIVGGAGSPTRILAYCKN